MNKEKEQENYGFGSRPLTDEEKAAKKEQEKDKSEEWQRRHQDGIYTKDPADADNRFRMQERAKEREAEREKEAKEAREKAAKEVKEKSQEKGGSWLNRSVTADLAKVAKGIAGGKEIQGENSLTSSLAKLIEKGQEKAMEKLEKERNNEKENTR